MPSPASSKKPAWALRAPVKAPRSCPKNWLSISSWTMAPQLTATNGDPARGDRACSIRAATSLPTPVFPQQQDRQVRGGDPLQVAGNGPRSRATARMVAAPVALAGRRACTIVRLRDRPQPLHQSVDVIRLGEVVVGPCTYHRAACSMSANAVAEDGSACLPDAASSGGRVPRRNRPAGGCPPARNPVAGDQALPALACRFRTIARRSLPASGVAPPPRPRT